MTLSLLHGNSLALPLPDQSVHLIVTSPPYFALRSYRDDGEHFDGQIGSEPTPLDFLAALWAVMDECWRVLRDDGSCWVNLGDKFAGSGGNNNAGVGGSKRGPSRYNQATGGLRDKSRMLLPGRFAEGMIDPEYRQYVEKRAGLALTVDPPQWVCRMDAVWSKANGLPESVTDRVRVSHESWFHFTKSGRYYSALDAIREEHTGTTSPQAPRPMLSGCGVTHRQGGTDGASLNRLGKLPGSVWEIPSEPLRPPVYVLLDRPDALEPIDYVKDDKAAWRLLDDKPELASNPWPKAPGIGLHVMPAHFAAFPSEFPRRIVLGWSPSGVCVRCGEGRRPVCERGYRTIHHQATDNRTAAVRTGGPSLDADKRPFGVAAAEVTITGTACACPTPDASTRPSVVLDPFSGTATAPIVADALGRHGVGVDLSWDYLRLAHWRDTDGRLREKIAAGPKAKKAPKPRKVKTGGLDLFGMPA